MASTFTTDAQRLVALSIGKIAASRSQRGGINLHKNLLVASVLHKARTSYMMENFQNMLSAKKAQAIEQHAVENQDQTGARVEPVKYSTSHAVTPVRHESQMESGSHDEDVAVVGAPVQEDNKENSRPACLVENMEISSQENTGLALCEKKMDRNCQLESDNSPVSHRYEKGVIADYVTAMCQKCTVKRRRSCDQENDSSCPKKAKLSSDNENIEHMQVETTQINNLVSIFNSGMSDVCTNSDYSSIEQMDSGKNKITANVLCVQSCQNRKTTMESFSCSVQVKDSLCDNLPTVIALTV